MHFYALCGSTVGSEADLSNYYPSMTACCLGGRYQCHTAALYLNKPGKEPESVNKPVNMFNIQSLTKIIAVIILAVSIVSIVVIIISMISVTRGRMEWL